MKLMKLWFAAAVMASLLGCSAANAADTVQAVVRDSPFEACVADHTAHMGRWVMAFKADGTYELSTKQDPNAINMSFARTFSFKWRIVRADDQDYLQYWRYDGGWFGNPIKKTEHGCAFHILNRWYDLDPS